VPHALSIPEPVMRKRTRTTRRGGGGT
jgi:hypothetical protein